jgi:hypothetical protein
MGGHALWFGGWGHQPAIVVGTDPIWLTDFFRKLMRNRANEGGGLSSLSPHGGGSSACREVSDIVGLRRCSRFGSWDTGHGPSMSFEVGLIAQGLDLSGVSGTATASHLGANHEFAVGRGFVPARATAFGAALRLNAFFTSNVYAGVDLGLAGGAAAGATTQFGPLSETPESAFRLGFGAVLGVATRLGPITLRGEVLGGINVTSVSFASHYLSCDDHGAVVVTSARVEPRVALEAAVGPWASVGVMGGATALDTGEWSGMLYTRWTTRAYYGVGPR